MEISTKFDIGDEVVLIGSVFQKETCPLCRGMKKVTAKIGTDFYEMLCPSCSGVGNKTTDKKVWGVKDYITNRYSSQKIKCEYVVKEIKITEEGVSYRIDLKTEEENAITTFYKNRLTYVSENVIFKTKEEALEFVLKLNEGVV